MLKKRILLIVIFLAALLLRLLLITSAHHGDLNNNISWGQIAAETGLNGFYGSDNSDDWPYSAPNQPPLYILLFAGLMKLWLFVRDWIFYLNWELLIFPSSLVWFWDDKGMDVMAKLPGIIADLGIGWVIYKYLVNNLKSKAQIINWPIIITAIWLFNPITWYNSAVWGQTDSLVNLLGLLAVFALLNKKLEKFALLFTLSILYKGSLAIFIPVLLFIILWQKYAVKRYVVSAAVVLFTTLIISFWFHPYVDIPMWFLDLYKNRILPGEIGFLTANAFNFWWIVDSGNTNDSALLIGLPARVWGYLIALTGIAGVVYWLNRRVTDTRIFASLMIIAFITFLFMTRIHERYLYPFFPYATLFLAKSPGFLVLYILISLVHLLNLYNLFWIPSIPAAETYFLTSNIGLYLSFVNLFLLILVFRHLRSAKV